MRENLSQYQPFGDILYTIILFKVMQIWILLFQTIYTIVLLK